MRAGTPSRTRRALLLGAVLVAGAACSDATTPPGGGDARAPITIAATLTSAQQATIAGMSVEVTGPGIGTPIIATLAVNGATVNGTVEVPVGASRTFTVRAFDAQGTETYNGSATATVVAGTNPPLTVRMTAVEGSVPIDVTVGTYGVTLTPPAPSIAVNGEVTLTASVTADGQAVAGALTWGVVNPALVTLTVAPDGRSAVVRGRIAGSTRVVASYEGVAAASAVTIADAPANQPPVANANGPYQERVDIPFYMRSTGSHDPDGTIVSYLWNFGDGRTSTLETPMVNYSAPGSYTVTLTVTDDEGATATATTTATINQSPTVTLAGPTTATTGVPATFTATGVDVDGHVVEYRWSTSDGRSAVTATGSYTLTWEAAGTYTVYVSVVDDRGAFSQAVSRQVTVSGPNQAPTVSLSGPASPATTAPATFTATGTDTDGTVVRYRWTTSIDVSSVTTTTNTLTRTFFPQGTYTVTVVAIDDDGAVSQPASMTVTAVPPVGNQPPFANPNGPYAAQVNTSIQFTSNGSGDPDGGALFSYTWSFGDGANSISGLAFPTHAYAAAGTYTVTLTVVDDEGAITTRSTTATITDPPVNQPPTVSIQSQFFGTVGNFVSIYAGCTDPEGATKLTWNFTFSDGITVFPSTTGAITHTFYAPGNYQVSVNCVDDKGAASTSKTAIITIQ